MRKRIVAGNWKMNLSFSQANALVHEVLHSQVVGSENQEVIFAPPFPYLQSIQAVLIGHPRFHVAAQNCHGEESGAYTGEVSAPMLQSIGVGFVILGHSERRQYFGETDALVARKVLRALESGIRPIYCCGEPLEIRQADGQQDWVAKQLAESLGQLSPDHAVRLVIAYEPVWAIGTGLNASPGQVQEMHSFIRNWLESRFGREISEGVSILYGGSCKPSNARELFACPDVDGGLIGGASLNAGDFLKIIQSF